MISMISTPKNPKQSSPSPALQSVWILTSITSSLRQVFKTHHAIKYPITTLLQRLSSDFRIKNRSIRQAMITETINADSKNNERINEHKNSGNLEEKISDA